jgi:ParB family chromosome partitioning protein
VSERRRGLGRGLGALIPAASGPDSRPVSPAIGGAAAAGDVPAPGGGSGAVSTLERTLAGVVPRGTEKGSGPELQAVDGAYFAEIPLDAISPNPRQPREVFEEEALAELVHSIREVGLLQPVVVRQISPDRYELIMGERRWRASREAGLEAIPAIVRATDDEKMLLDALLENLHRSQLNPLEEAAAYDQLLRDFSCSHEQLADRIGRSRSQVSNTLRLLKLPPAVQRRLAAGVLQMGHARALLGLEDTEAQEALALRIPAEGLSVRTVEEIVALSKLEHGSAKKPQTPRPGKRVHPALASLASRLSDRFDTRVKVELGKDRGKIVVEYASMDDLDRILALFAPGEGQVLKQEKADGEA